MRMGSLEQESTTNISNNGNNLRIGSSEGRKYNFHSIYFLVSIKRNLFLRIRYERKPNNY